MNSDWLGLNPDSITYKLYNPILIYFWSPSPVPLMHMPILRLNSWCLNYYCFIGSLEIRLWILKPLSQPQGQHKPLLRPSWPESKGSSMITTGTKAESRSDDINNLLFISLPYFIWILIIFVIILMYLSSLRCLFKCFYVY